MSHPNGLPDGNIDPGETIQGHNGQLQRFELKRSLVITDPRRKAQCREFLLEDQFGNVYLVYRTTLHDGEEYDVADWVKPSVMAKYGGFTDALIDDFRGKAFHAFDNAAKDINAARAIASKVAGSVIDGAKLLLPSNISGGPN